VLLLAECLFIVVLQFVQVVHGLNRLSLLLKTYCQHMFIIKFKLLTYVLGGLF